MYLHQFEERELVSFEYLSAEGEWKPRVAIVASVRDITIHPLSASLKPLHRGRHLVTCFDLGRCAERSFYSCRARHARRLLLLPATTPIGRCIPMMCGYVVC